MEGFSFWSVLRGYISSSRCHRPNRSAKRPNPSRTQNVSLGNPFIHSCARRSPAVPGAPKGGPCISHPRLTFSDTDPLRARRAARSTCWQHGLVTEPHRDKVTCPDRPRAPYRHRAHGQLCNRPPRLHTLERPPLDRPRPAHVICVRPRSGVLCWHSNWTGGL